MQETVGTLSLKIARLEHRLRLLTQQQALSSAYPTHHLSLAQEILHVQGQLKQLSEQQALLLRQAATVSKGAYHHASYQERNPLHPVNQSTGVGLGN